MTRYPVIAMKDVPQETMIFCHKTHELLIKNKVSRQRTYLSIISQFKIEMNIMGH